MIFRRFAQSRIAFSEKLRNTPSIIFSDLLESAVYLEICFKEKIGRVMKDIESRLNQLELVNQGRENNPDMQRMKERFHPVMTDIERRLIALETRPVETSISNVSFTEENPATMTTLIERVQVLESRVNNLEPSNSTLHSSISSTPLEPPEDHRRKEGSINEPSSSSTQERPTVSITQT